MNKLDRKIFKKLCSYVGADLDTILTVCSGQWPYDKYEWTEKQEINFRKWLDNEYKKYYDFNFIESKYSGMFILAYGWKTKKES